MVPFRIGNVRIDPPVLQAPMAGFTNYAYRQMVRHLGGVGLAATEMVHARGFLEIADRGDRLPDRLWGVRDEPRPLAVQIWDSDPGALAAAAARLAGEFSVSVIDINFGCPVRQVSQRAKSGSYLLAWPDRVGAMVARVVRASRPTPVMAKIRLGPSPDRINAVDVGQAVAGAGAAALTVHGRTAQQMFRGSADWNHIAAIQPHLGGIPLIGNGDLRTAEDVVRALRRYPVDGVMIGRAGLARPWLFRQAQAAIRGEAVPADPTGAEQKELLLAHHRLMIQQFGGRRGTILMRKFACCFASQRRGAKAFRRRVVEAAAPEQFIEVVLQDFPDEG